MPPSKYNIKEDWLNYSKCWDTRLGTIFWCNEIRIQNNYNTETNSFRFYDFVPGEYCFKDITGEKIECNLL